MKKLALTLGILSSVIFAAGLCRAADLDSTSWRIHEKGKTETEDLIFIDGRFTSSGCIPYGFISSSYSSTKSGDAIKWDATQMNKENEKMVWSGQAKGKDINGTYVFTDKKGKTYTEEWLGKKIEAK